MIIARIIPCAGMGNQMFMYAAGLSASSRLNTDLRLGAWDFNRATRKDRPYELSCFPAITEPNASFIETWRISPRLAVLNHINRKPIKRYHIMRRLVRKAAVKFLSRGRVYDAQYASYSPEFHTIEDNTYITGYYESEKIFAGIKDLVRKKFTFAPECFDPLLADKVKQCNSVALHVRRGDKLHIPGAKASDERYIREAMQMIFSLTDKPSFFVFSDDIEYCKVKLSKIYDAEYTFIEGKTPPQDMALMTLCKHAIISVSTFSWWGAWLNDNPNKIIIAPDVNLWYSQVPEDRKYLLPESWIKIG